MLFLVQAELLKGQLSAEQRIDIYERLKRIEASLTCSTECL